MNSQQSVFRIYRLGQRAPTYIYRFITSGTMEERIHKRQVNKTKQALLVMDEIQSDRKFRIDEMSWLYDDNIEYENPPPLPKSLPDTILTKILNKHKDKIYNVEVHENLFSNSNETLTPDEIKRAWAEYESDKKEDDSKEKLRDQNMLRK